MKSIILSTCLALFLLGCGENKTAKEEVKNTDSTAKAKDTMAAVTPPAAPMDSAAMMKAWNDYMTPGAMHAMIAKCNGTFNAAVTVWMAPGAPPQTNTAKTTNKMILGGRYQESHSVGSFGGMPFEGYSTLAYDNMKKIFQSTWIDNMGSGIMYMEGTWDSTAHAANFKGKFTDPMTGKDTEAREIFTITSSDEQKMEMFVTPQGSKEYKSMEITYKRSK